MNIFILVACPVPIIANGSASMLQAHFFYGTRAYFHCDAGFTLNGFSSSLCQLNLTWDRPIPTCGSYWIISCISRGTANPNDECKTLLFYLMNSYWMKLKQNVYSFWYWFIRYDGRSKRGAKVAPPTGPNAFIST